MDIKSTEYFGSESQQLLQSRADNVWHLLRHDQQFSCHGRAVALAEYTKDNLQTHIALARLQGVCPIAGVDERSAKTRKAELEAEGLVVDQYVEWNGGAQAFKAAQTVLANRQLQSDLAVHEVDLDTSSGDLQKLDALTQSCDVLLPMGSFLRGEQQPSVFLYAQDAEGRVVGASAAVAEFHPDHPKSGMVWWGMLATDQARRGEGIALILGAMALQKINVKFGYESCFTGIRKGNAPSEALCTKLGLTPTNLVDLIAISPSTFSGGQLTK